VLYLTPMTKILSVEEAVEKIVNTVKTVEFLHGVPVDLPNQYKANLITVATHVLTAQRLAGANEAIKKLYAEIRHEEEKFLDGFAHPKDCVICTQVLTLPTSTIHDKQFTPNVRPSNYC